MDAAETRDTDAEIDTLVHFDNEYMQQAYELVGEFATSYTCSLVLASISPGANGNVSFKSVMTDVGDDYIGGLVSEGVELVTGQSNFLIDQITGLLVGQTHGDLTPGHVSSRAVDINAPNGSRVVANAVDDINVNRMIPDVEVSGVDLPNGIREIPDGVQAKGIDNNAGAVDVVNTGKVPEVDLPKGKVDVKTGIEGGKYSSLRDLMSPEEIARYDKHWLNVAENISNEALDNQIEFIKNGGITRQNGKIYEPSKVCCAVDLNTGDTYIGYSGTRGMNPSKPISGSLEPDLQILVDNTKDIARNTAGNPYANRSSFYSYPVDNCAEIFATNNALLGGADIDNIFLNTRNFWSGEYAPPCDNCKITFRNFKMPIN